MNDQATKQAKKGTEHPAIKIVFGLGNPGAKHQYDRHNAGFWLAERLATSSFALKSTLQSELAEASFAGETIKIARPMTFMNKSGDAVQAVLRYFRIEPEAMLVVHDELDLSPGDIKLKFDGGHGGQNGLRDIIAKLGHGRFWRMRVGIGHPGHKDRVTPWVLGRPNRDDSASLTHALDRCESVMPDLVCGRFTDATKTLHTANGGSSGA